MHFCSKIDFVNISIFGLKFSNKGWYNIMDKMKGCCHDIGIIFLFLGKVSCLKRRKGVGTERLIEISNEFLPQLPYKEGSLQSGCRHFGRPKAGKIQHVDFPIFPFVYFYICW